MCGGGDSTVSTACSCTATARGINLMTSHTCAQCFQIRRQRPIEHHALPTSKQCRQGDRVVPYVIGPAVIPRSVGVHGWFVFDIESSLQHQ